MDKATMQVRDRKLLGFQFEFHPSEFRKCRVALEIVLKRNCMRLAVN